MADAVSKHEIVQPAGWPRPKGYSNGVVARGRTLFLAGQVGWDESERMVGDDIVSQFGQALRNIVAIVSEAGGSREDVVRMTIFCADLDAYRQSVEAIGVVYREVMGKHFPVMSLIGVAGLIEEGGLVEIEATAVLPD